MPLRRFWGLGIYALIALSGRMRRNVVMSLVVAAVTFCVLWGWGVWLQHNNLILNNDWLREAGSGHLRRTLLRVALLPSRMLAEPMKGSRWMAAGVAVIYVLPILLWRKRRDLWLWALIWWVTVAMLALLDAMRSTQQLQFLRYSVAASPAVYVLISALPAGQSRWLRHMVPLVALIACASVEPYNAGWAMAPALAWEVSIFGRRIIDADGVGHRRYVGDGLGSRNLRCVDAPDAPRAGAVLFVGRQPPNAQDMGKLERYRTVWLISNSRASPPDFMRGSWQSQESAMLGINVMIRRVGHVGPTAVHH